MDRRVCPSPQTVGAIFSRHVVQIRPVAKAVTFCDESCGPDYFAFQVYRLQSCITSSLQNPCLSNGMRTDSQDSLYSIFMDKTDNVSNKNWVYSLARPAGWLVMPETDTDLMLTKMWSREDMHQHDKRRNGFTNTQDSLFTWERNWLATVKSDLAQWKVKKGATADAAIRAEYQTTLHRESSVNVHIKTNLIEYVVFNLAATQWFWCSGHWCILEFSEPL